VGVLLIWVAAETVINFILDFYRPRIPGQVQRPFYDSRLLGMFSEPGGILQSMAKAIDYQFGFKVSETWFFKLLGRAIMPLLIAQVAILLVLSMFVVVPVGHQAVVEHLGRPRPNTLKPGLHLTWCWPIDRVQLIPVERIQRMAIGYEEADTDADHRSGQPILWTQKHFKTEYQLLVAERQGESGDEDPDNARRADDIPVNLVAVNIPLQWRVKDDEQEVLRYYRQSSDAAKIIESLAYRELTRYAAAADMQSLLGKGGLDASRELWRRIQHALDTAGDDGKGLGVKIEHLGIGGVHPPSDEDVAKTYEEVVNAFEKRDAEIKKAEGEAAESRISSAGTQWERLHKAILAEEQARMNGADDLAARTEEVERLLRIVVGGQARELTAGASEWSFERIFSKQAAAERYGVQLAAFKSAPQIYLLRSYLRLLEEGLANNRKIVVAHPHPENVIYDVDLRPPTELDVLGSELKAMEAPQPQ
jgi:regulator of protease activity HflC (stomatin/prohibitin superfamily)